MFISRFMIQILHNIQNVQEEKRHQKKETSNFEASNFLWLLTCQHLAAFVMVPSAFGRRFKQLNFE
jgi:hypothetical protein